MKIHAALPVLWRDLMGGAGAGLISLGAYDIYTPAGKIVLGAFLLAISIQLARRG